MILPKTTQARFKIGWPFLYLIVFSLSFIALSGCATSGYLETKGMGIPPSRIQPTEQNRLERRSSAKAAALIQAQYEMLSILKGVRITGGVTVQNAMVTDSTIKASVDDVLQGATIEGVDWRQDDSCTLTLRVSKDRVHRLMGVKF